MLVYRAHSGGEWAESGRIARNGCGSRKTHLR